MSPTAQFKADLERGKAGEQFLCEQHSRDTTFNGMLTGLRFAPEGERRWDLERYQRPGGLGLGGMRLSTIEVKTDSYDPERTPNFFMELLTTAGGTYEVVGGPWRARADKVDVFVYLYHGRANPPRAFWFYDLDALCKELDRQPSRFQMRSVKLDRLKATGLLVPRSSLASLYTEVIYGG